MFRKLLLIILATAALSACTTIHTQVPDFPTLTVTEHKLSFTAMLNKCYPGVPTWLKLLGSFPLACADINFVKGTCDIYTSGITSDYILEHERAHCAGGDHFGEIQGMLDRYKQSITNQ